MRYLCILSFLVFFISCGKSEPITSKGIVIEKTSKHPFLIDHCRLLITKNSEGEIIDELEIYCDPGIGCMAYHFSNGADFTLIDCNGQWYSIEKSSGNIDKAEWNWMEEPPGECIFKYVRGGADEYNRLQSETPQLEDIYQIKDPL